jgi:hypothetical protein
MKRLGRIMVSKEMYEGDNIFTLLYVFSQFVPIKMEEREDFIEYIGVSPMFEESDNIFIPTYIGDIKDGTVKFEKV